MVEPAAEQITHIIHSRHHPASVYNAQTLSDVLN